MCQQADAWLEEAKKQNQLTSVAQWLEAKASLVAQPVSEYILFKKPIYFGFFGMRIFFPSLYLTQHIFNIKTFFS